MIVYQEPNYEFYSICPICGTNEKKPVFVIPADWTEKNKEIKAFQVHVECLNLILHKNEDNSITLFHLDFIQNLDKKK